MTEMSELAHFNEADKALILAASEGRSNDLKRLLLPGLDNTVDGLNMAFTEACRRGHTYTAIVLMNDERVDVFCKDWEAMHWVGEKGYDAIGSILLQKSLGSDYQGH